MMMEERIKEILQKHDIQDEKLANALAEIYELFHKQSQSDAASEHKMNSLIKGIQM